MPVSIYGLTAPGSKKVRYVGKTALGLRVRLTNHVYNARSGRYHSPFGDWIRKILREGKRPDILLLQNSTGDWKVDERKWIRKLTGLLNRHPGGNGAHTRQPFPAKFRALLGKVRDAEIAKMVGLGREAVCYHRLKLGIPSLPRSLKGPANPLYGKPSKHPTQPKPIPLGAKRLMGKIPDGELGRRFGVAENTAKRWRRQAGVVAYPEMRFGENHHGCKLTSRQVAMIRRIGPGPYGSPTGLSAMAKRFGVGTATIWRIQTGRARPRG
jgi:hypothetical protein